MKTSIGVWRLIVALPLLLLPLACESPIGPVRATTFPPDLGYLPPAQIRTAMWVLAAEIKELERVLRVQEEGSRVDRRLETRAILERMRIAAHTLDQPGRSSQHPVLNENLKLFMDRLERAKRAVDREPPDYYVASTIAGSCYLCHGQTKATAGATRGRLSFTESDRKQASGG
jgi:hypothetical protein